jgi:hypothetical protein
MVGAIAYPINYRLEARHPETLITMGPCVGPVHREASRGVEKLPSRHARHEAKNTGLEHRSTLVTTENLAVLDANGRYSEQSRCSDRSSKHTGERPAPRRTYREASA